MNNENLMSGVIDQMNRCRKLVQEYENIGPVGIFGATMIKATIQAAENAIKTGDIVAMVESYQLLKECN